MGIAVHFQLALLRHTLANEPLDGIGSPARADPGMLFLSLHSKAPAIGADQSDNEAFYRGYSRAPLARSAKSWVFSADTKIGAAVANLRGNVDFGECSEGVHEYTYFGVGVKASGAGMLVYAGELLQPLRVSIGRIPRLLPTTRIVVR